MFTTLAHLGHDHSNMKTEAMSGLDHSMPIIISAGIVIIILFLIILYFLMAWQPKTSSAAKTKLAKSPAKKKTRR